MKLLSSFGSRADVAETANGYVCRKEVLRKHRAQIEREIGGPLAEDELRYLYGHDAGGSSVCGPV